MKANFQFETFNLKDFQEEFLKRLGEIKIGEKWSEFSNQDSKYAILGISEDIGPLANFGKGSLRNNFNSFISAFSNVQSNEFLNGQEICIYGNILQNIEFSSIADARIKVEELDILVEFHINQIIKENKIPIVIGGGHNNAYPIIKAISKFKKVGISVVNLDAHADCRILEGRHSGNPFSYSIAEGFLKKYAVLGLHENYNSTFILDYIKEKEIFHTFFDGYIIDSNLFNKDLDKVQNMFSKEVGIDLDMDCIEYIPTSAMSPSGFSLQEARNYILKMAQILNVHYLHLTEGASQNNLDDKIIGKSLSYLVSDFIKAHSKASNNETKNI